MPVADTLKFNAFLYFSHFIESDFGSEVSRPPLTPDAPENLLDLTPDAAESRLRTFFEAIGEPAYRARQVVRHLWIAPAADFQAMTDVPKRLRDRLAEQFEIPRLTVAARQTSKDGTEKFLFRLRDGEAIETVAI